MCPLYTSHCLYATLELSNMARTEKATKINISSYEATLLEKKADEAQRTNLKKRYRHRSKKTFCGRLQITFRRLLLSSIEKCVASIE